MSQIRLLKTEYVPFTVTDPETGEESEAYPLVGMALPNGFCLGEPVEMEIDGVEYMVWDDALIDHEMLNLCHDQVADVYLDEHACCFCEDCEGCPCEEDCECDCNDEDLSEVE